MKTKFAVLLVLIVGVLGNSYANGGLISDFLDGLHVSNAKVYKMETSEENAKMLAILSTLEKHEHITELDYQETQTRSNKFVVFSEYLIPKEHQDKVEGLIISFGLSAENLGKEDKKLKINYIVGKSARFELV